MSKWVFCQDTSKLALDQINSQQFNSCFCFSQKQRSQHKEQKSTQKVNRKKSLKSLKPSQSLKQLKSEINLNKNANFQPQNPVKNPTKQQAIVIPSYQQPRAYFRQPNHIVQPKVKVNLINFDPQVSEAYCYYPQMVRVQRVPLTPVLQTFRSQKIINYRPLQSKLHSFQPSTQTNSFQQTPVKQKVQASFLQPEIISKHSNKFYSQPHCKSRSKKQVGISQVSKSADFRQISINKESRINLHQIKCVRAVSINDSSKSQQQVSILVQPIFKGINFQNEA